MKKVKRTDGLNNTYSLDIMERVMSTKEIAEFHQKYASARFGRKGIAGPTKSDVHMLREYKKGATVSELAQKNGISMYRVERALMRASIAEALKG